MFKKDARLKTGRTSICKQCNSKQQKKRYITRKEEILDYQTRYRETHREKLREYFRKYQVENPEIARARNAARRARKKSATCNCCSREEFKRIYKNRPDGYHVDHIKPLSKGGLHCVRNLQYLTAEENLKKGDKYETPCSSNITSEIK